MRTWMSALALLAALSPKIAAGETPSPIVGHIEFLWSAPVTGSGARPVALGLLTRPEAPHLACWKTRDFPQRAVEVRLELDDDAGRHALWAGTEHGASSRFVRCGAIDLAALGVAPGTRRATLRFDGRVAAAIVMDVAERLESSGFVQGDRMFVDGRTDSPEGLAAADYAGRFVWVLTFDSDVRVIDVSTEVAEGLAATRLRAAGSAAARLYPIGRTLRNPSASCAGPATSRHRTGEPSLF